MNHFEPQYLYYWSHTGPEQTSAFVTPIIQILLFPPTCSVQIHTNTHKPSVCTPGLHLSSLPLCSLSPPSIWTHLPLFFSPQKDSVISFVVNVAFLWHLSLAFVSSVSSHADYLFCFPPNLIRGFHFKHQKASWQSCILGRAPEGKCKQGPVKLQHRQQYHTQSLQFKKTPVNLDIQLEHHMHELLGLESSLNCQQDLNYGLTSLQ